MLLMLALGGALLAAGGAFAFLHFRGGGADAQAAADAGENGEGGTEEQVRAQTFGPEQTLDLGEFLVNVLDRSDVLRYLKAKVSVVVQEIGADPERAEGESSHGSKAKDEAPQLPPDEHRLARDAVVEVLSSQRFEELRDDQGRQHLRKLLQQRLDQALKTYRVNQVLITDFVMQ